MNDQRDTDSLENTDVTAEPEQQDADQPVQPHAELIDTIVSRLDAFFAEHTRVMLEKTEQFLFDSANHASSIAQQNSMFEFMNALRAQKDDIERKFYDEFNVYLKPIGEAPRLPKKKSRKAQTEELSLVGNDEMDELVTMTTISSKANTDFQEEINHLTARLQQVAMKNPALFHPEALKPIHVCDAFRDSLVDSDFDNANKMILYKQFDQEIIRNIKTLYDDLNKLLIEADVLPEIKPGGGLIHSGAGHDDYADDAYEEGQDEGETGDDAFANAPPPGPGGYAAGPRIGPGRAGARSAAGAGQASAGAAGSGGAAAGHGGGYAPAGPGAGAASGTAPATGQPNMAPSGDGGGAASGAAGGASAEGGTSADAPQGSFAGMPLSEVRQSIEEFIGGVPSEADSTGPAGGGGGYYSHQQVVGALSDLQANTQISDTQLEFNASAIKKAVLSTIGDKEGGVVDKRVNQISEKTIDFIKLIFDAIIDDKSITDTIKALLLSLQIPVIKAAMLDSEFFVDDMHPARLLLDKIAEAGVGVSDHKDPVYIDIEAVVRKLLVEYKEDVEAFTEALEALTRITEDIYEKARQKEEESQRQVKHAHARNVVLQEIRKITLGKELPHGIRTLVLKVWPSLMFNHYLDKGKANDEWVEMLMILAKIIDSVQPVTSRQELEELGVSYEEIVAATEGKLKQRGKSSATVERVIADLRSTYEELMQARELPEEQGEDRVEQVNEDISEPVPEAVPGDAAEESEQEDDTHEPESLSATELVQAVEEESAEDPEQVARRKVAALPDEVQPGAWFIVYHGEDKPVRRLKLAVILMQDATLVFVDHLGNVVIEKDADVFSDELERGLSGVIMQHSVFDHALRSALGSITH